MVDGLDPDADDVRHPGDYIEDEMVPYIDRAISGENVYSQDIIDTTWGPIFTACYPVSANRDGTGEIIGAFCIEMDMQSAYGITKKNKKKKRHQNKNKRKQKKKTKRKKKEKQKE